MEKVSKRYCSLLHSKKDVKISKKDTKKYKKSACENFCIEFQKNHTQGLQKITSKRLTLPVKKLTTVVASSTITSKVKTNSDEINDDLLKFVDKNRNVDDESTSKSIFREIEEKFQQLPPQQQRITLNDSYIISDEKLIQLLAKKLSSRKNLILDPWSSTFKRFLQHVHAEDLQKSLLQNIISNQDKINQSSALFELKSKFRGVPLADTCLRRKFVRRCNELTNIQNLGAKNIIFTQAGELIRRAELNLGSKDQIKMDSEPERCTTPENKPPNFPITSYKTPENQKFVYRDHESTSNKLQPAIMTNQEPFILQFDQKSRRNQELMSELGISMQEQNRLITESEKFEKIENNNLFGRPKKVPNPIKPEISPTCRQLFDFKSRDENQKNFDFKPLDNQEPFILQFDQKSRRNQELMSQSEKIENKNLFGRQKKVPNLKNPEISPICQLRHDFKSRNETQQTFGLKPLNKIYYRHIKADNEEAFNILFNADYRREVMKRTSEMVYSPTEYNLRKKYAPETLGMECSEGSSSEKMTPVPKIELKPMPSSPSTPKINNYPRFQF